MSAIAQAPLWVRHALLEDEEAIGAVRAAGLDRLKGIAPIEAEEGCQRWPAELLLRWERGLSSGYIRGRCKATNLCRYCQRLYTAETVEMLILDALEHTPVGWSVLTAREHLTRAEFNEHLKQIRKRLRRQYPDWEYFVAIEFQPQRRVQAHDNAGGLHGNVIHKGLTREEFSRFQADLAAAWCERVDAELAGQWGKLARDGVAVMKYVTKTLAHGLKTEQAPPIGWKGHRTSQSRRYLVRPASEMRQEARESLRRRGLLARLEREIPELEVAERHELVEQLLAEAGESWWSLIGPLASAEKADALVAAGEIWREGTPGEIREHLSPSEALAGEPVTHDTPQIGGDDDDEDEEQDPEQAPAREARGPCRPDRVLPLRDGAAGAEPARPRVPALPPDGHLADHDPERPDLGRHPLANLSPAGGRRRASAGL